MAPTPPPATAAEHQASAAAQKLDTATLFDRLAPGYDHPAQRFFLFCADHLVRYVQPARGERVLDVATGTGHVATAAARAVAGHTQDGEPGGRVQAIDLSPAMLERATGHARHQGLDNLDFQLMDAEALAFSHRYFDIVTCGFGLFFMPDMDAALRQWFRVLKPGGRIGFSSFGGTAFMPLAQHFETRLADYGIAPAAFVAQRLTEPGVCKALLEGAGFVDVDIETAQLGYHLESAQDWWDIVWNTGFRARLDALSADQRTAFREAHLDDVRKLATDDGIWLDVTTLLVRGYRPAG